VLQSRFADVRYYDMIIESEREDPLARDDRWYDHHDPIATVDHHVFADFPTMH
jgi:hypothetical protein